MNPVTWFSIPADNIEQTKKFYNKAFGWQIQAETKKVDDRYSFNVALTSPSNDAELNPTAPATVNGCIIKRQPVSPRP